jgi:hypothetical protein
MIKRSVALSLLVLVSSVQQVQASDSSYSLRSLVVGAAAVGTAWFVTNKLAAQSGRVDASSADGELDTAESFRCDSPAFEVGKLKRDNYINSFFCEGTDRNINVTYAMGIGCPEAHFPAVKIYEKKVEYLSKAIEEKRNAYGDDKTDKALTDCMDLRGDLNAIKLAFKSAGK